MTTETNSAAGVVTPAATDTSAQNTTAAPAANANTEPTWLPGRIEQAKRSAEAELLKSIGVSNVDEAKALAAAAKARADADKTAETRAAELAAKLDGESKAKDATLAVVKEHAARMLIGLTVEQKAAVAALAGDDPVKTLHTITALAPTWAAAETAKAAADKTADDAAKTAAKPGTTAPGAGAPNGKTPASPDPRASYEQMRSSNPFAAAFFGSQNPDAYRPK